jgi:hypothetical protein
MGKKSTTQPKDRALDVPAEANRDKHMNYLANDDGTTERVNKMQYKKGAKKEVRGTHAPGFRHLPDDPRNLPTENTSMEANRDERKKS